MTRLIPCKRHTGFDERGRELRIRYNGWRRTPKRMFRRTLFVEKLAFTCGCVICEVIELPKEFDDLEEWISYS